ncbi:unnamed protein product [Hyaloperonospora brassicae]|uniref:Uncharacterized protein n=1 Tax=Hyaloperonospora brassicae TaxID=162125 RepID=A0AAV0TUL5_HYABA|nr:unnamed protein product [Hyaloperonospora brassicae]
MSTPETIGHPSCITAPFNGRVLVTPWAIVRRSSAATVRPSTGALLFGWTPEDKSCNGNDEQVLPTFVACSQAIIAAAERMATLVQERKSLAVAVAYDECLDIVTAAVNHMEAAGSQATAASEYIREIDQATRSIRDVLIPSPYVRRALQF